MKAIRRRHPRWTVSGEYIIARDIAIVGLNAVPDAGVHNGHRPLAHAYNLLTADALVGVVGIYYCCR